MDNFPHRIWGTAIETVHTKKENIIAGGNLQTFEANRCRIFAILKTNLQDTP